ncbi:MAG: SH3 domain-containing protein [Clostridia bacterium]|nr:SH3 domain-containing protein [Clostridia bacterium]
MKKMCAVLLLGLLMGLCDCSAMAQAAVVHNGSDPSARLHLREQPDKGAASLGRFYTGTPVEIIADAGGGFVQVVIGSGRACVSGYMLAQYLAPSAQDATVMRSVVSPYGTPSVVVRSRPSNSYDAVAMLEVGRSVCVIGTAEGYCYVLLDDGGVGCLAADELK